MGRNDKRTTTRFLTFLALTGAFLLTSCGKPDIDTPAAFADAQGTDGAFDGSNINDINNADHAPSSDSELLPEVETIGTGIDGESAKDANIDFAALKEENPDIIGWLQVPHTNIDAPILQSSVGNTFYEDHNAHKEEDRKGALYIEQASMPDFSDFLTVIYGHGGEDGLFSELHQFSDPDFFEANDVFYLYLDGNLLTYTVYAAQERENTSLLRSYDFTSAAGCGKYLKDFYDERIMGKLIRTEWEEGALSPYFFLTALTATDPENPDTQYVVFGCLTHDAAGTVDRSFAEDSGWDPSVLSIP